MAEPTSEPGKPADAIATSWVDWAPARVQPYLRLMRLDRPIGTWLLFWPSVFGLTLGATVQQRPFGHRNDIWLLFLFAAGAVVMRGAGCTFNDLVDRNYDRQVARTATRPIASGEIGVFGAVVFLAIQLLIGLLILLLLRPLAASPSSKRAARRRVDALVAVVPADPIARRGIASEYLLNDTRAGSAIR